MQWGRAVGAAACLAVVAVSGAACATAVEGQARAQQDGMIAAGPDRVDSPAPPAVRPVSALPTCADLEKPVTSVLTGYRLDRDPRIETDMTLCWFSPAGAGEAVTVSVSPADQTAEELASTRDYLARAKPDRFVAAPSAERLGGYISEPLGDGNLALAMPGAQVVLMLPAGTTLPQQQVVDVLVAVGSAAAG